MRGFKAGVEKFEGCGENCDCGCRNFDFGFFLFVIQKVVKNLLRNAS
jgi:hypothetical protein